MATTKPTTGLWNICSECSEWYRVGEDHKCKTAPKNLSKLMEQVRKGEIHSVLPVELNGKPVLRVNGTEAEAKAVVLLPGKSGNCNLHYPKGCYCGSTRFRHAFGTV
jgi:hypothetical protein